MRRGVLRQRKDRAMKRCGVACVSPGVHAIVITPEIGAFRWATPMSGPDRRRATVAPTLRRGHSTLILRIVRDISKPPTGIVAQRLRLVRVDGEMLFQQANRLILVTKESVYERAKVSQIASRIDRCVTD